MLGTFPVQTTPSSREEMFFWEFGHLKMDSLLVQPLGLYCSSWPGTRRAHRSKISSKWVNITSGVCVWWWSKNKIVWVFKFPVHILRSDIVCGMRITGVRRVYYCTFKGQGNLIFLWIYQMLFTQISWGKQPVWPIMNNKMCCVTIIEKMLVWRKRSFEVCLPSNHYVISFLFFCINGS